MPTSSWSQDGCQDADLLSLEGRKIFLGWEAPNLFYLYPEQSPMPTPEPIIGKMEKDVP